MRVVEIDPRDEYKKSFCGKHDDTLLDFIFDHGLFPRKIYFPSQTSAVEGDLFVFSHGTCKKFIRTIYLPRQGSSIQGYLLMLYNDVCKVMALQNEDISSVEKMIPHLFGAELMLKNQDDIFEERGELVMTEYGRSAHTQVEKILSRLYPTEKCHYLGFQGIRMGGQAYHVLLQVGFLKRNRLRTNDTLPGIENVILKDEKPLIYPVFEDILKRMLFLPQYLCLN